jgi:protoheme IX farnesyltransferase
MTTPQAATAPCWPISLPRRVADFLALTKPRVVLMVLITTAVGFYLGSIGELETLRLVETLFGTALAAGGTIALNQFIERDGDALMERTRHRPLPEGRIRPLEALTFGLGISVAGIAFVGLTIGLAAAGLNALTVAMYLFLYTPLKRKTPLCSIPGAISGALPPMTGWVAARGDFGIGAWILFAILFLWQFPHSLAIGWLYRADYARAGIRLLPVVEPDGESTGRQIVSHALALLAVGLLPSLMGLTGNLYFLGALALGILMLACGMVLAASRRVADARRLLLASLVYLPVLLALMALDKIPF